MLEDLLAEVVLQADESHRLELGLEPIYVRLLVLDHLLELPTSRVVADPVAVLDRTAEELDRPALQIQSGLQ